MFVVRICGEHQSLCLMIVVPVDRDVWADLEVAQECLRDTIRSKTLSLAALLETMDDEEVEEAAEKKEDSSDQQWTEVLGQAADMYRIAIEALQRSLNTP